MADSVRSTPGELLPCPFCGGPAKFSIDPPNDECWVACENDHCDVAPAVAGKSPKDAYSGWNRRAVLSETTTIGNLPEDIPTDSFIRNCEVTSRPGEVVFVQIGDIVRARLDGYRITPKESSETREKFIRCVWVVERDFGYGKAMRVVCSDHPRFSIGTRFDFGFLNIAIEEGYRIQIDPVPPHVLHDMEEARREREQDPR